MTPAVLKVIYASTNMCDDFQQIHSTFLKSGPRAFLHIIGHIHPWQSQNYCSYIQDCSLGHTPRSQSMPQQVGSLSAEILTFFCNEEAQFHSNSTSTTQNRCPKDKCATVTAPTRNVCHQRRHMTTFVSQHLNLPFLPRDSVTSHSGATRIHSSQDQRCLSYKLLTRAATTLIRT